MYLFKKSFSYITKVRENFNESLQSSKKKLTKLYKSTTNLYNKIKSPPY